jgi:hypothetical protein
MLGILHLEFSLRTQNSGSHTMDSISVPYFSIRITIGKICPPILTKGECLVCGG